MKKIKITNKKYKTSSFNFKIFKNKLKKLNIMAKMS